MPFPLALIPAIIGAVSATVNRIKEVRENKKTNEANLQLAKYQQDANMAQIDKQNAYNTPLAQMNRFDAAGLNPNLVYGQGNSGNQSGIAQYEAPRIDYRTNPMEIPQMLGMYQDFMLKNAQIGNVEAQTSNIQSRTETEPLRQMLMQLAGRRGEFELKKGETLLPFSTDILHGQAQSAYSKTMLDMERLTQARIQTGHLNQETQKRENDLIFQEFEKGFRAMGVTNSDSYIVRMFARMMQNLNLSPLRFNFKNPIRINRKQIHKDLKID